MEEKQVEFKNLCSREYFGHKRKVSWLFPFSNQLQPLFLSNNYSAIIYAMVQCSSEELYRVFSACSLNCCWFFKILFTFFLVYMGFLCN